MNKFLKFLLQLSVLLGIILGIFFALMSITSCIHRKNPTETEVSSVKKEKFCDAPSVELVNDAQWHKADDILIQESYAACQRDYDACPVKIYKFGQNSYKVLCKSSNLETYYQFGN